MGLTHDTTECREVGRTSDPTKESNISYVSVLIYTLVYLRQGGDSTARMTCDRKVVCVYKKGLCDGEICKEVTWASTFAGTVRGSDFGCEVAAPKLGIHPTQLP